MKRRRRATYSRLREQLRRERAADFAKLSPAERLKIGLEFSDFCLKLAAAGRRTRAAERPSKTEP
jgi:hypothetical protein